jgi:hypothetical protein
MSTLFLVLIVLAAILICLNRTHRHNSERRKRFEAACERATQRENSMHPLA